MAASGCLLRAPAQVIERLISRQNDMDQFLCDAIDKDEYCTVEKTWNAIEFAISQLADLGKCHYVPVLTGGIESRCMGPLDTIRYLFPPAVCATSHLLGSLDFNTLKSVLVPHVMSQAGVYPDIWDDTSAGEVIEYVWPHFAIMTAYYNTACDRGEGMLLWLT